MKELYSIPQNARYTHEKICTFLFICVNYWFFFFTLVKFSEILLFQRKKNPLCLLIDAFKLKKLEVPLKLTYDII